MRKIIIGTRGSKLALKQAEDVIKILRKKSADFDFSLNIIKTKGDKILDVALSKIGDKGLFVKEIENELIGKNIDMAVHSLKDLPSAIPEELTIGAVPERVEPRDVIISRRNLSFHELPDKSVIGTSSLRRKSQLLHIRKDLIFKDIRGNLDTRLKKLEEGEIDVLVLAAAGIIRMGWSDKITEYLPWDIMLPAVGQGCIALEIRKDDKELADLLSMVDHRESRISSVAERSFLKTLEGGCQIPIGALGMIENNELILHGLVADLNGEKIFRDRVKEDVTEPERAGLLLAEKLIEKGAGNILKEIRDNYGK